MLEESLKKAPIVQKGKYNYVIHPITDGIPDIEPALLEEVVNRMLKITDMHGIDRIITAEAMGIPIASLMSVKTGIPFTIIRKREYGLEGELSVQQVTGYSRANLYINGIEADSSLLFVDDVLSTGGTLIAIAQALRESGAYLREVLIAVDKSENREAIEPVVGVPIKALCRIKAYPDHVEILESMGL